MIGMDNLGEQISDNSRKQFLEGTPSICPLDCTDLIAVTDCDLGRMEKTYIRSLFMKAFDLHPKQWADGVSAADWRVKLTHWASLGRRFMSIEKSSMIVNAFKSCGF